MSGVSFVVGWVYAHTPDADRLMKGPYDPDSKKGWDDALAKLAAFNKNVVLLGRGEPGCSRISFPYVALVLVCVPYNVHL